MQKRMFFAIILTSFILSFGVQVVLAQGEEPPEVPYEAIHAIWTLAIATPMALIMAFANVMAGYLSKTSPKNFKLENFIFTLLISLTIGFVTVYGGWTLAMVQTWLANGFLTWYFWKIATILARIITKKGIFTPPAVGPPA